MTDTNNDTQQNEFNEADSKADAVAAFLLIALAVAAMVFLVA